MKSTESVVSKRFFLFISLFCNKPRAKRSNKKNRVCMYVYVCMFVNT